MKKSDLKFGNVVELRDGTLALIHPRGNYDNLLIRHYYDDEDCVILRNLKTAKWESSIINYNLDLTNTDVDSFTIIKVYEDYTLKNLLWERKELLTNDEKEWLSAVIKPFRDKIFDIEISSDNEDETYISIDVEGDSLSLPYIRNLPFKFKGLKFGKRYTLEELGL